MDENHVCRAMCDVCYETDLGVRYSHLGKDVLFKCRRCEPQNFEQYSRQDIDSWLNGGDSYVDP